MLMTQLQNQDPTSPLDTNQFTSELVQFSGVEQQINTNASLTQLISLTQSGQMLQASSMVGSTVQLASSQMPLQNGSGALTFTATSAGPAEITISNAAGAQVLATTVNATAGSNNWTWNGENSQGNTQPDGPYTVTVTGANASGTAAALPFTVSGTVTGVVNNSGTLDLQLARRPRPSRPCSRSRRRRRGPEQPWPPTRRHSGRQQPPEPGDLAGGVDAGIQHERLGGGMRHREAVRHAVDGPDLDGVAPDPAAQARTRRQILRRRAAQPVQGDAIAPPDCRVGGIDHPVGAALPDRNARPAPRHSPPAPAPARAPPSRRRRDRSPAVAMRAIAEDTSAGAAHRHAGHHRAGGEHVRIGGQQRRRHGAAGRKPGDEHAAAGRSRSAWMAASTICRIDRASPPSRAMSPGSNQLKHRPWLLRAICSGSSSGAPSRSASAVQPAAVGEARRVLAAAVQQHQQRAAGARRRVAGMYSFIVSPPGLGPNDASVTRPRRAGGGRALAARPGRRRPGRCEGSRADGTTGI